MITQDQIKDLRDRQDALRRYLLTLLGKRIEINQRRGKRPSILIFWNNPREAETFMKALRLKKKWVSDYESAVSLTDDAEIILEFFKEGEGTEENLEAVFNKALDAVEALEFRNMLSEEGDDLSAVLQITAGAGGTESCDWAEMLMRMYLMWAEKNGFKVKELNFQQGDVAGIKTVTIEIAGEYAFGWLKSENGVHRLVRISPFDSNAKRHTSFASVYVYPLVDDSIQIDINPADIFLGFCAFGRCWRSKCQ